MDYILCDLQLLLFFFSSSHLAYSRYFVDFVMYVLLGYRPYNLPQKKNRSTI